MNQVTNIFGNTQELNAVDALQLLEAGVCEGISTNLSFMEAEGVNMFGRRLRLFRSSGLAALSGLTATGLRGAAFLSSADLGNNLPQLASITREKLATVIHCLPEQNSTGRHYVTNTGCFQLSSSSPQEAVDFAILAHKIAEQSLIPGLQILDVSSEKQMVDFADVDILRQFLGRTDDHIICPTPAQQILFGSHRRRIPNWFNFDHPILHGIQKTGLATELEAAANQEYFHRHLSAIIDQAFSEFANLTGWHYRAVQTHQIERANFLILAMGPIYPEVAKVVDRLQDETGSRVSCIRLNVVQPFPKEELAKILKGRKGVTILEPLTAPPAEESQLYNIINSILSKNNRNPVPLYYGQYGQQYSPRSIELAFKNMMRSGAQKQRFYLDTHFTLPATNSPTHEILLHNIRREYPDVEAKTLHANTTDRQPTKNNLSTSFKLEVPMAVRRYADNGPPYSRLARFYNDTAHFYEVNESQELVADPFQALPLAPPATAAFSGIAAEREELPTFHPEKCTACGACFVQCPHAAIPPIALGTTALVKGAMQIAAKRGTPASKLTPLVRNVGKIAGKIILEKADSIQKASDFLPEVFKKSLLQARGDEEKKKIWRDEMAVVEEIIQEFPVAVTEVLFKKAEKQKIGSGELFSLAIDPHTCTACGLCVEACEEEALEMQAQTADHIQKSQTIFQLWEQLPDTAGNTVSRLQQDPSYDPFSATLLSRNFYLSMNGAARDSEGEATKKLLHLITALTESVVQPQMNNQLKTIQKLTGDLAGNINKLLTKALPSKDFDTIAAALSKTETPRLPLDELIGKFEEEEHLDLLNTSDLQRKIELHNDLKLLLETIKTGPTGVGRSRYGLILASEGLPWMESFPSNAFTTPVIIQAGPGSPEKIEGLIYGHIRHSLDNIRLLRRAKLEIRNKYEPGQHDQTIAALDWSDLDKNEQELIPPLLLVGTTQQLAKVDYATLQKLLTKDWPVKVFLLNTDSLSSPNGEAAIASGLILSELTGRKHFILQSGTANHRHLFNGLIKGLSNSKPALFHLFAADDQLHEVIPSDELSLQNLIPRDQKYPFFAFDPETGGDFTSYPQKVKEVSEAKLKEKHEQEIVQLRKEYEEKLQKQEEELMKEVKTRLRERLLSLSRSKQE